MRCLREDEARKIRTSPNFACRARTPRLRFLTSKTSVGSSFLPAVAARRAGPRLPTRLSLALTPYAPMGLTPPTHLPTDARHRATVRDSDSPSGQSDTRCEEPEKPRKPAFFRLSRRCGLGKVLDIRERHTNLFPSFPRSPG